MEETQKKYLKELARVLNHIRIQTGEGESGELLILLNGEPVSYVDGNGRVRAKAEDLKRDDIKRQFDIVSYYANIVKEYTRLVENAPLLKSDSGNEDYSCLTEFNGIVLAGIEVEQQGYMFATWERDATGTGFCNGNYFHDGYEEAKNDFITRSGLVDSEFLFTEDDLTEMYHCIQSLKENHDLSPEREELMWSIEMKIVWAIPDLKKRLELKEQTDTYPKMDL